MDREDAMELSVHSPGRTDRVDNTSGSAADRVYSALRERIVALDLPPGATLSRGDLARQHAVSQTPVREALQRLEQDGLVRIFPQSRTVVAPIDVNQLNDSHFLRVALECEVVRKVTLAGDTGTIRHVRGLVRMQEALMGDVAQMRLFDDLDKAFHRALFDAAGVDSLSRMLTRRLGHLARCQRLELPREGKMAEILHGHVAVVEAISAGDPDRAATAMRAHISGTIRRIALLRDDHPDYFSGSAFGTG